MKVALITCLNERPAISRILMNTIDRLRAETAFEYAVAAVSTKEDEALCRKFDVDVVQQPNITAGHKWNAVLNHAMMGDYTHFLIMGDDDSISSKGYRILCRAAVTGRHYVGFKRNYFIDTQSDQAYKCEQKMSYNKLIGAGCLISRQAIIAATEVAHVEIKISYVDHHWQLQGDKKEVMPASSARYLESAGYLKILSEKNIDLWPPKGNGLDHSREMRLTMAGYPPLAVDDDKIHISDFKSARNIWSYESAKFKWHGDPVQKKDAMWYMTDKEISYIYSIKSK